MYVIVDLCMGWVTNLIILFGTLCIPTLSSVGPMLGEHWLAATCLKHSVCSMGLMLNDSLCHRLLGKQTGLTPDAPFLDPCLPLDIKDEIQQNGQTLYLRGTGDFDLCRETLQPFMNKTNETQTSLNGIYQPPIHFQNSEFYGFSEFYYCTEDVLRMGGDYNAAKFTKAAKVMWQESQCCEETMRTAGPDSIILVGICL